MRTSPVYPRSFFHRGLVRSELNLYAEAIKDYRAAIEKLPFHFESHYNLGLAYLKLGSREQAMQSFLQAAEVAAGEKKAMALYNAGIVAAKLNKKAEARNVFEEAIRLKPDYLKPRYGLASLEPHTPEGRQRAQAQFDLIVELKPNFAPTFFRLGRFHASFGDAPAAEKAYRKAIELYPEYSKARYNLGLLYLAQERLGEARAQFQWLLDREPDHAGTHYNLGRIAFREKSFEEALTHYRQAVEARQGRYPEAYFGMGLLYAAQDKYDEAAQAYELGLKYRKAWPEAHFNLGLAFLKQEKWSQAEKGFRNALRHNPRYPEAWYNLGVLYARWGRDDDAIQSFRQALEIRPDYTAARLNLGVRYARKEQYAAAIAGQDVPGMQMFTSQLLDRLAQGGVAEVILATNLTATFTIASSASDSDVRLTTPGGTSNASERDDVLMDDTDFVAHAGVGARYAIDDTWGVRLDARALFPPSSEDEGVTVDLEGLLGIYVSFGAKGAEAPPVEEPEEPPADEDGDGIVGESDQCPTEPEDKDNFEDENGCPDPDNDGDGIADEFTTVCDKWGVSGDYHEFAFGPTGDRAYNGASRNPHDTAHITGGSSGGTGGAGAGGLVPFALGSDTNGSIRVPSSFCGLFGLKPSRGRVPLGPQYAEVWQGAVVEHVLTRSVRDSAALLDQTNGMDEGAPQPLPREEGFLAATARPPGRLKVAVSLGEPLGAPLGARLDPEVRRAVGQAAHRLEAMGHAVEWCDPPVDGERLADSYLTLYLGHLAADLAWISEQTGVPVGRLDIEPSTRAIGRLGGCLLARDYELAKRYWNRLARAMGEFQRSACSISSASPSASKPASRRAWMLNGPCR